MFGEINQKPKVIVFFGGNGSTIRSTIYNFEYMLKNRNKFFQPSDRFFTMDYPGIGLSADASLGLSSVREAALDLYKQALESKNDLNKQQRKLQQRKLQQQQSQQQQQQKQQQQSQQQQQQKQQQQSQQQQKQQQQKQQQQSQQQQEFKQASSGQQQQSQQQQEFKQASSGQQQQSTNQYELWVITFSIGMGVFAEILPELKTEELPDAILSINGLLSFRKSAHKLLGAGKLIGRELNMARTFSSRINEFFQHNKNFRFYLVQTPNDRMIDVDNVKNVVKRWKVTAGDKKDQNIILMDNNNTYTMHHNHINFEKLIQKLVER